MLYGARRGSVGAVHDRVNKAVGIAKLRSRERELSPAGCGKRRGHARDCRYSWLLESERARGHGNDGLAPNRHSDIIACPNVAETTLADGAGVPARAI